jgi:orotidine-5'-phosphate decarboxylase
MDSFGVRLERALRKHGPLCVGIDPHAALLSRWGLPQSAEGLRRFCDPVIEAVAGRVAVVKPQSAFFERFGSAGIAVLESIIRKARQAGALVLLDVKRGDIGSTAQAYAQAYLAPASPLYVDAITVHPYPGFGSLAPILDEAEAHGGGVFVLAATSNPEGPQVQQARTPDGRTVTQVVVDEAAARNVEPGRHSRLGNVGVVIGATTTAALPDLSRLNGPVLVPGLGVQGGSAADLAPIVESLKGVIVASYSREILSHGPSVTGLREAVERCQSDCLNVLKYPIL